MASAFLRDYRYERWRVLAHDFTLRSGTFRLTPDYDDAWVLACARRATCVFDIGANVGYDALLALSAAPIEHIVLIEPNPEALAVAADNLIRNGLSRNARFVPMFASDVLDEKVHFWTIGTGAAGSMYAEHAVTAAHRGASLEVLTVTVDALCEQLRLRPDLVKIDVEGAETQVLRGSKQLGACQKTRFLVEMHSSPVVPMITNARKVLEWCQEVGCSAWYLKAHQRLDAPEQIAGRGRCHLLLQPGAWEYPEWLRGIEQSAPLQRAMKETSTDARSG